MPASTSLIVCLVATFDSPKVPIARYPSSHTGLGTGCFFVPDGDIFDDRLVTFLVAARPQFIRKW
jgi:hypothetical protein